MSSFKDAHGLCVGDEVDVCACNNYWSPARVEAVEDGGAVLFLRVAATDVDITTKLDLRQAGDARRIAPLGAYAVVGAIQEPAVHSKTETNPNDDHTMLSLLWCALCCAGTKSVPLLDQQPVDYLRRTAASEALGASEQWQRGESIGSFTMCVLTCSIRVDSFDRTIPYISMFIRVAAVVVHKGGRPGSGFGGSDTVSIKVTSSGDAVLGVSYGVAASSTPSSLATNSSTASASASPGRSPDRSSAAHGSISQIDNVDPASFAPPGAFAKWVPTHADIAPSLSSMAPPQLRDLRSRGRGALKDSASVTGRLVLAGRVGLRDYDLIDVLPPLDAAVDCSDGDNPLLAAALSSQGASSSTSSGINSNGFVSSTLTVHGCALPRKAGADSNGTAANGSLSEGSGPGRPSGDSNKNDSDSNNGAASPSGSPANGTASNSNDGIDAKESSKGGKKDGSSLSAVDSILRKLSGKGSSGQEVPPEISESNERMEKRLDPSSIQCWHLARVRWEARQDDAPDSSSSASASEEGSTASKASGGNSKPRRVCVAYWFAPEYGNSVAASSSDLGSSSGGGPSSSLVMRLHSAPVTSLRSVAPPGTYTIPYVAGQQVEVRRFGGLWAPADVIYADRLQVRAKLSKPPLTGPSSRNAIKPRDTVSFGRGTSSMTVTPAAAASAGGTSVARRKPALTAAAASRDSAGVTAMDSTLAGVAANHEGDLRSVSASNTDAGAPVNDASDAAASVLTPLKALTIGATDDSITSDDTSADSALNKADAALPAPSVDTSMEAAAASPSSDQASRAARMNRIAKATGGNTAHLFLAAGPVSPSTNSSSSSSDKQPALGGLALSPASPPADADIDGISLLVSHSFWRFLIARQGHYCADDAAEAESAAAKQRTGVSLFRASRSSTSAGYLATSSDGSQWLGVGEVARAMEQTQREVAAGVVEWSAPSASGSTAGH